MNNFSITFIKKIVKYKPKFYFANLKKGKNQEEKQNFASDDEKILSKLMKKIQENNNNLINKEENEKILPKEELQKILSKYKVTYNEALLKQILRWRENN